MIDGGKGGQLCPTCGLLKPQDRIAKALQTIDGLLDGESKRYSQTHLAAAKIVLDRGFLPFLSDEDLLAEVRRRNEAAR